MPTAEQVRDRLVHEWEQRSYRATLKMREPGQSAIDGLRLHQEAMSFGFCARALRCRHVGLLYRWRTNASQARGAIGRHQSPTDNAKWSVMGDVYTRCANELELANVEPRG